MSRPIRGVSKSSLWRAWKAIRKDLKRILPRDVVDHLEYDVNPDVWIKRMLKRIGAGMYEPETPERVKAGKSLGFSRTMTFPSVPDIVLYRAIADYLFHKAKRRQHRHVYFQRGDASQADETRLRALGIDPATGRRVSGDPQSTRSVTENRSPGLGGEGIRASHEGAASDGYGGAVTLSWFINWQLMSQYRTDLIKPERPKRWFVITDITNFFDSVLHDHVAESLRQFSIPPRMIGLLLFLLERLAIRDEYAHSPAIGLPVDQLGGSRTIAHLVLFTHDDEVVPIVGGDQYLRWMDDQLFVVPSRAEGLMLLSRVQDSLGKIHLTPNAKKTKIMSRPQALRHYHLDINQELDSAQLLAYKTVADRRILARKLRRTWNSAKGYIDGDVGESVKILERFYLVAGRARARFLRSRCAKDILSNPALAERAADYVRHTGTAVEFWTFTRGLLGHSEQVYSDVNLILVEALLRLEAKHSSAAEIRRFATPLLKAPDMIRGGPLCAAVAPLLMLRFGDGRSMRSLVPYFSKASRLDELPHAIVRACAIVYGSQGRKQLSKLEKVAGQLLRNRLAEMVRLLTRLSAEPEVPARYKSRLALRRDTLTGRHYIDMRTLVTARLLRLNERSAVQQWVRTWRTTAAQKGISAFDRALLDRLLT